MTRNPISRAPLVGALCIAAIFAASADAATVFEANFNFMGPELQIENPPVAIASVEGNLNVRARGFLGTGPGNANDAGALAYRTPVGLGVQNTTIANDRMPTGLSIMSAINTFQVDGLAGGEFLRLEFDAPVRLISACFTQVGAGEQVGVAVAGQTPTFLGLPTTGDISFPTSLPFATAFDFYAPPGHSAWNLAKLEVEVIPEPSSAIIWSVLLLAAIAGGKVFAYLRQFRAPAIA